MIAKLILTAALLIAWLYAWMQSGVARLVRVGLYGVIAAGIYFVWHPDESTQIANVIGIGRGADLIFYIWIVLSFGVIVNLHLKLRQNLIIVTQIARHLALANPYSASADLTASDASTNDSSVEVPQQVISAKRPSPL